MVSLVNLEKVKAKRTKNHQKKDAREVFSHLFLL